MVAIMGDLNTKVGKEKIYTNIGINGDTACNRNGKMLIDFVLYKDLKIVNSLLQHKDSHKCMWSVRDEKSITDYIVCNRKLSDKVLDKEVYWGPGIESNHCLVIALIRVPPKWVQKKCQVKHNKEMCF